MKKEKTIIEQIVTSPLEDLISDRYGDYAKYIIQERALPDARDGLKPVQRRILYAMNKDGNTFDKGFRKSAKTVGLVIGNYHPHGDSSVYEAMVRLSQDWKINHPLVQMHGNNGSIDDDPPAAMRYTEARLSAICKELLEDIDKDTVNWTPNFDDTENEPTVLPAKFPSLLVNGSTGIASGYATNIPPHNLAEVIDGTIYRIEHPDCSLAEIMQWVKGPDFPTKGIIQGVQQIKEAFETGKGKVVVRANAEIIKQKTIQQIVITEIPYEVIKAKLVNKIDNIRFNKDIDGILEVRDESDRNGLRIVVDVHKEANAEIILKYLYKNTDLQTNYSYNMVAIVDNRPCLLGLAELMDAYINFAKEVILRRSHYELQKRLDRCHILEGLIKAVSVLDEVIQIIRHSKDKTDAKNNLIQRFDFTSAQAEAIVILRLYRLTNTDVFELKQEYKQLIEECKDLRMIIAKQTRLNQVLIAQLQNVKKQYGHSRYSMIEEEVSDNTIDKMDMITNERVVITLSKDGYIKKVSLRSYKSFENTLTGIKAGDQLIGYQQCDSIDTLLAFSESGEYICLPLYQLEDSKWKDIGKHLSNYVKINNNEKFIAGYIVKDFNTYAYILSATSHGYVKKTPIAAFQLQRTGKSSIAMSIPKDEKVVSVKLAYQDSDVLLVSQEGYSLRFSIDDIPAVACKAKGVIGIRLAENDQLADMEILSKGCSEVVLFTEKGTNKRLKAIDVPMTNRATKGILIAKKNKTNSITITNEIACNLNDDLQIIKDNQYLELKGKDIGLLSAAQRFSINTIGENWYHYPGLKEVRIIDIPVQQENKDEQLTLEV